jgi:predicted benzoate:H+ symporter BenE
MNEQDPTRHSLRRAVGVMAAGITLAATGVSLSVTEALDAHGHSLQERMVFDIAESGLLLAGLGTLLWGLQMPRRSRDEHKAP